MKYKKLFLSVLVLLFLAAAGSFIVEYWTFFPYRYSQFSHFGYEELVQKIRSNMKSYDRIIVSSRVNDAKQYIYYVFYTRYDPVLFQSGRGIEKVVEPNGWVRVKKVNAISFLPSLPNATDIGLDHVLLIGASAEFPKQTPVQFTVKDKKGDIVFVGVDSHILYPIEPSQ
jgi:hypothetical protein